MRVQGDGSPVTCNATGPRGADMLTEGLSVRHSLCTTGPRVKRFKM